jgi:hypothetical protein
MATPTPETPTAPVVPHPPIFWLGFATIIAAACIACAFLPFLLIPLPFALLAAGLMVRQKRDRYVGNVLMLLGVVAGAWLAILVSSVPIGTH